MHVNPRSLSNIFRGDGLKSGYPFSFLDKLHPGGPDGKESACNAGDGYNPWVGKIHWRRKWQPTSVFSPGELHGQRSLVDYSPWGCKELDTTEQLRLSLFYNLPPFWASLVAQTVKNLPVKQKTRVRSLGWEDPLEESMATHSSSCLENPRGQRSLADYSPWGRKESDMTEQLKTKKVKVPAFSIPVFSSLSRAYEAAALLKWTGGSEETELQMNILKERFAKVFLYK